jgi:small subunit ribosomal protein S17
VYKVSKVFLVHDEKNIAKLGDVIQAQSCRPISKSKSWRLLQVVK